MTPEAAQISVIIPTFNGSRFLGETVASVVNQTYPHWELIVVDDGSTDDTVAVAGSLAASDPRIRLVEQANQGVAGARNRGLAEIGSRSQFVAILDHDDLWEPHLLASLQAQIQDSSLASAAYGFARFFSADGPTFPDRVEDAYGYRRSGVIGNKIVSFPPDAPTTFSTLVVWPCIATPGQVLIRRAALDACGSFDPNVAPSDDWDLWIRLSLLGDLLPCSEFVMRKRAHATNLYGRRRYLGQAEPKLRAKLYRLPGLTSEQRRIVKVGHRASTYLRLEWAASSFRHGRVMEVLKHLRQFGLSYSRYLQLSRGSR